MSLFDRFKKSNGITVLSPIKGFAKNIGETSDAVFAEKMMGDGITIEPTEGKMYAPVAGKITVLFPTKHAIGITTEEGLEILLHFGIDTVKLDGQGFETFVSVGQEVAAGDLLLEADLDYIKAHAPSDNLVVVFTAVPDGKELSFSYGDKNINDVIVEVK